MLTVAGASTYYDTGIPHVKEETRLLAPHTLQYIGTRSLYARQKCPKWWSRSAVPRETLHNPRRSTWDYTPEKVLANAADGCQCGTRAAEANSRPSTWSDFDLSVACKRSRCARTQEIAPRSHARGRASLACKRSSDGTLSSNLIARAGLRSSSDNPCRSTWGNALETVVVRMLLTTWKT